VYETNWDTIIVRCKDQIATFEKWFTENALIPDAYRASALGMESGVMVVPQFGKTWSISV